MSTYVRTFKKIPLSNLKWKKNKQILEDFITDQGKTSKERTTTHIRNKRNSKIGPVNLLLFNRSKYTNKTVSLTLYIPLTWLFSLNRV